MKNKRRLISFAAERSVDVTNTFIIIITWVFMVILVNPIGDFPLNDDWAYGWTVKTLLEKGDFQLSDWTATNLLSQVVWGALFCLPFGFSFTALRLSTLTLGLIGVVATYGLLREVKTSPTISLIGAFIVALNPIYLDLSNSFNSDVPSFTFVSFVPKTDYNVEKRYSFRRWLPWREENLYVLQKNKNYKVRKL